MGLPGRPGAHSRRSVDWSPPEGPRLLRGPGAAVAAAPRPPPNSPALRGQLPRPGSRLERQQGFAPPAEGTQTAGRGARGILCRPEPPPPTRVRSWPVHPSASPSRWDSSGVPPTRFFKWSREDGVPGAVAGNHPLSHHHLPLPVSSLVPACALPLPGLAQGLLCCRTSFRPRSHLLLPSHATNFCPVSAGIRQW